MKAGRWMACAFRVALAGAVGLILVGCGAASPSHTLTPQDAADLRAYYQKKGVAVPAVPAAPGPVRPPEEIWVIEKERQEWGTLPSAMRTDDAPFLGDLPGLGWLYRERQGQPQVLGPVPGGGGLVARRAGAPDPVTVPLRHTDVSARISGYIGTVEVTQQFHNPFNEKIEADYVFPLPHDAAINEFVMTIGERRIRGIIREREEARQIYEEARAAGKVASLLTQERPNIFSQRVANIEPGKAIDVNIKYFHVLPYVDGWYEFVFPMVVGPRYNPPGTTDGVGAVGRDARGASGQATEVPYLRPRERSGHDIAVTVDLDAGVALEDLASPSHAIVTERPTPERARVRLSPSDTLPNKDFVLRYKVAGATIKTSLLTHRDARGGFFTLTIFPPEDTARLPRAPMEMIFVLDRSGSMDGAPLAKAKAGIERALRRLEPGDTFQVVEFSDAASQLGAAPVPATPANVERGIAWLRSLAAGGGTEMMNGIRAALDFPHDPARFRIVSFWTDGFIGNEAEILGEIRRRLGAARIFSFGIGSSVNRYLIAGMARVGNGAAAFVGLDESSGAEVDRLYERLRHPGLTDVAIDWDGLAVTDVFPARVPDLLVGRPVVVTGRFAAGAGGRRTIRVTGRAGGEPRTIAFAADLDDRAATHPGIPLVWARTQIRELDDAATAAGRDPSILDRIRNVALEFGLVSAYTAFVAVDSLSQTAGDHGTTVKVAVPVPEGVRYDTTVQERGPQAARLAPRDRR